MKITANSTLLLALLVLASTTVGQQPENHIQLSESKSFYDKRPYSPGKLKSHLRSKVNAYPDVDVLSIGNNGTPFSMRGSFGEVKPTGNGVDERSVKPFLNEVCGLFDLQPGSLVFRALDKDEIGGTHLSYDLKINGKRVIGGNVLVHVNKDNIIYSLSGSVPDENNLPSSQGKVGSSQALGALKAHKGKENYFTRQASLVYFLPSQNQPTILSWEIPYSHSEGDYAVLNHAYVNANSNELVEDRSGVAHALWRDVRNFNLITSIDFYANPDVYYTMPITSPNRRAEGASPVSPSAVNYLYDNIGKTYNYFNNIHGRNSMDGVGSYVYGNANSSFRVGYSTGDGENAYYVRFVNGERHLYLGYGNSSPAVEDHSNNVAKALDVVAHEFTHGIADSRAIGSLGTGANETGAINEGLADVFGAAVEQYNNGLSANTWLFAEGHNITWRSLKDPTYYNVVDYYPSYGYYGSGAHKNSGITALAFYLASIGGQHTNPSGKAPIIVPDVGITVARNVFYNALVYYLPSGSGYAALKTATYEAALDLYGTITAAKIALAWDAVGVPYGADNLRAVNISTRAWVGTSIDNMVAGFVLGDGTTPKNMLIRGVGPELTSYGVSGALSDPLLTLNGITSNDDWEDSPNNPSQISTVSSSVGAFALVGGSHSSALLQSLGAGAYSVNLSGISSSTGNALLEIYDTDLNNPLRLKNISTRAKLSGSNSIDAGFVVNGTVGKTVLIRGVGPELGTYGIPSPSSDPTLALYLQGESTPIYTNNNWSSAWNSSAITSAASTVGAFPLTSGSNSSAILLDLPPGVYTAVVSGSAGTSLVEVYEVP